MGGRGWAGWSGVCGGKWDNCNSIINKYIKKNKIKMEDGNHKPRNVGILQKTEKARKWIHPESAHTFVLA